MITTIDNTPLYVALATAKKVLTDNPSKEVELIARYVVDHLGPLLECGYESPVVNHNYNPPLIDIPEYIGVPVQDAQTIAASILRACDEAKDE